MAYQRNAVHTLYKKLLRLYPREFREHLEESMEQTFNDLYEEQKRQTERGLFGFVPAMPLGLTYITLMFNLEPLASLLNDLFTVAGQQGDINMLGRIVIYGGLLLLPVAFALNLQSMLKREGPEGKEGSMQST